MKKIFTFFATALMLLGAVQANAQSEIPGTLDLSTTTVEQGDGPELHASAGWNGTNIDWMQSGQKAIINFKNTVATSYNIVYKGGTPNTGVQVTFEITNANGATAYKGTSTAITGGWGDKTSNKDLPATDVLPTGDYTLTLTYFNPDGNTTVNIYEIDFQDVNGTTDPGTQPGTQPTDGNSFYVDLSTIDTSESKGGSLNYMEAKDEDPNTPRLDYPGAGSIGKFEIDIPTTAAYKITFNYASPMDKMFMYWTLTDASGKEVYNEYLPLDPTGAPGDFWTIYKDFEGLAETPVLEAGKYTLRLYYNVTPAGDVTPAWYDGSENAAFHSNIKEIKFTVVGGAAGGPTINLDLTKFDFATNANNTGNWNGEKLDYFQFGDVIYIPFTVESAGNYNLAINYATIMSNLKSTFYIQDLAGNEVWRETVDLPFTTPEEGNNEWSYQKDTNAKTDATLAAGNYNLFVAYDNRGWWEGSDNLNFQSNIYTLALVGKGGAGSATAKFEYLGGSNLDKEASDNNIYKFTGTDFTLSMNNRDKERSGVERFAGWSSDIINFKNNDWGIINVPAGKKVYALQIGGYSESEALNLCYLYTVDVDDKNVFTEAIGQSVTDNTEIRNAKYVIEPDGTAPLFATLDLTAAPATNGIKVVFSGNNQEDVWFKLYTTEEDANILLGKSGNGGSSKANITWTVNSDNLTFDGEASPASDFAAVTFAVEGQSEASVAAPIAGENNGINFLRFAPAEDKAPVTTTWTANLNAGATFTPTNVSLRMARFGTDAGVVDLKFIVDGNEIFSETGLIPARNNKDAADDAKGGEDTFVPGLYSKELSGLTANSTLQIVATFTELASNKQIGYAEVTIEGVGSGNTDSKPSFDVRAWDFTKWSDATVANLKADAAASALEGWSDVEKQADAEAGTGPTDISKDNAFWFQGTLPADGQLAANGVTIEETKGLIFQEAIAGRRNLAIGVNYPETSLGTYAGGSYLWLGGSGLDYFVIPAVEAGASIVMTLESHKPTDARGVKLSVNGTQIGDEFTPTVLEQHTWVVENGGDVLVSNTNGCHIYNIVVGKQSEVDAYLTGIETIQYVAPVQKFVDGIYNLRGQKVDASYKGIVIKNGKKYLQK